MEADDEGFMTLDFNGDASHGARNVVNFAQVCASAGKGLWHT